eukprot:gene18350-24043_t
MSDNYYKILNLSSNASLKDIKKSYKRLALLYHPDRVSNDQRKHSIAKFQEISNAYNILSENLSEPHLQFE